MKARATASHHCVLEKLYKRGMFAVLAIGLFACGGGWSPPEPLGEVSSLGGFREAAALGMSGSGQAMVVWKKRTGDGETVVAKRFVPWHGWGPEERLSGKLSDVSYLRTAMDAGGNATAVWLGSDGADARVEVRRFRTEGGWEPSETLRTTRSGSVQVAMNQRGDTALLWSQSDRLFIRLDPPGGRGTPQDIGRGLGYAVGALGIGLDETGGAVAAFAEGYPSGLHGSASLFTRVLDPLSGWIAPERRGGGWSVFVANLVVNGNGEGLLLWNTVFGGTTAFLADHYRRGRGWSWVGLAPGLTGTPSAGLDSQANGWAVFPSGSDPRQWDVLSARRLRAASGWQPLQTISSTGSTDIRETDVAMTPGGHAVSVWTASIGSRRAVLASQSSREETWRNPQLIAEREGTSCGLGGRSGVFGPHIGIDGAGNAIVVWIDWDCNTHRASVWSSHLVTGGS